MNWLDSSITSALGRALLHFVWEGGLIGGLLGVMLQALRRASADARYLAACAAMLAMIASFAATAIGTGPASPRVVAPAMVTVAAPYAMLPAGEALGRVTPFTTWAVAGWLAGVAILSVRRAGGWLRARRMVARATVSAEQRWLERLDRLRERMRINRAVMLVESALAESPSVMGWLRPVILVPAGWLMGLPVEQAEAVLLHELAHVRRHDYLINLIQSVVEDLLFYHPAVWWVGRVMRRERENCCDDAVVAMGADVRSYARTLASLEGLRAGEPAMAANSGPLADRIRRLVRPPAGPRASAIPLMLVLGLVCAGTAALPAWQNRPPQAAAVPPAPQVAPVPAPTMTPVQQKRRAAIVQRTPDPYDKWLNEDVVYIIRPEERAAFERLMSAAEKERFIEQFWEVRGGAAKREHYRRIAYANENFAEGNTPGWKTERGRAYIIDGPSVQVPAPNVQANGDSLYQDNRASVRVGTQGATLIKVDGKDIQITLYRITGSDGSGEVVLHESARSGEEEYFKLLALSPGAYRLVAQMSGPSSSDRERLRQLQVQLMSMQAQVAAAQQMYTAQHPKLLQMQTQLKNLESEFALTTSLPQQTQSRAQVKFRVP
jgi:GWxTD domain-containing protein